MSFTHKIKNLFRRFLPSIWVFIKGNKFLFAKGSFLNQVGYIESIRRGTPCAADGSPLPWMNYGIIELLKERLSSKHVLFEYGTGSSTLFWARRTGRVCAVEHDRSWHDRVLANLPANVQLLYRPSEGTRAYINAILECNETFDIIVVDGLHRAECLKIAPVKLSPGGVVILDDSDRQAWRDGVEHLLRLGFRQLRFAGLKPTGFHADETSVFYRSDNCLGI